MDAFIESVLAMLESRDMCFDRGAIVMRIPSWHRTYVDSMLDEGSPRLIAKTHAVFQSLDSMKKRAVCPECVTQVQALTPQVNIPVSVTRCQKTPKRVALMYMFLLNGHTYLYLKLETAPSRSWAHVKHAVMRYIFKTSPKEGRRENSYKDGYTVPSSVLARNREWSDSRSTEESEWYDTRYRTGSEVYIPSLVTDCLLRKNKISSPP